MNNEIKKFNKELLSLILPESFNLDILENFESGSTKTKKDLELIAPIIKKTMVFAVDSFDFLANLDKNELNYENIMCNSVINKSGINLMCRCNNDFFSLKINKSEICCHINVVSSDNSILEFYYMCADKRHFLLSKSNIATQNDELYSKIAKKDLEFNLYTGRTNASAKSNSVLFDQENIDLLDKRIDFLINSTNENLNIVSNNSSERGRK